MVNSMRKVRNTQELRRAIKDEVQEIEVVGKAAENLKRALQLGKVSKWTLGLLSISLAGAPFTGGMSMIAAGPIALLTGLEVALIIAVSALGVALVLAILKEYDAVEIKASDKKGKKKLRIRLRRRGQDGNS